MSMRTENVCACAQLICLGDSTVGKTCLIRQFCFNTFSPTFVTTIGIDVQKKPCVLDGTKVALQVCSTDLSRARCGIPGGAGRAYAGATVWLGAPKEAWCTDAVFHPGPARVRAHVLSDAPLHEKGPLSPLAPN